MIGKSISHYKILEKLGEGGMGVVYKAEDTRLKRLVALKFLSSHSLASEDEKTRFIHEAQAAAALDHPNICTVYEINEADGQLFIAMAYVEGQSLQQKIAAGPLKLDEAIALAIQIAEGLQAAHEKNIVHRDIKPANILITTKAQAQITDFGLAKLAGRTLITNCEKRKTHEPRLSRRIPAQLIEDAALFTIAGHVEEKSFRAERDRIYERAADEEREAAFQLLHQRWFERLLLGDPLREVLAAWPILSDSTHRCLLTKARSPKEAGAELYLAPPQPSRSERDRRTIVIQLF